MMRFPFTGNERDSVTFPVFLNGTPYSCQVKWNLAGQRWYLVITGSADNVLLNTPLVGSVSSGGINLLGSVFTPETMIWREKEGYIEVSSP